MATCLEDLPREVLLLLFKFLSAEDIYKSLYHLNARFDNLIRFFAGSKLRLDDRLKESVHDPLIGLFVARTLFPRKIFWKYQKEAFVPTEISETRLIGSFPDSLHTSYNSYNVHSILQLCPRLERLSMRYCRPACVRPAHPYNKLPTIHHQFVLQHLELYECSLDSLYSILSSCPKLLHLKFNIDKYPTIALFRQLASNLNSLVPLLDSLYCAYTIDTDSQDPTDYRLSDKENVLCQIQQMHRLYQNVSCNDWYDYCPHEGGTSWGYQAMSFTITGGIQSVFSF